jgi:acetylornithine deacetylase/succinyl-diaminopimelate desuccinylase-like protein
MQLFFGARGVSGLELTLYGPSRPLHSGHYGNWAPNPAVSLAHLIARMRDEEGRILIPGFHDDVRALSPAERQALAALPDVETALKRDLAIGRTEGTERLADSIARPSLNLRGFRAGEVGESAANVISPEAYASIDFRLVPDQTPERIRDRVEAWLKAEGWHVVHAAPDAATRMAHARVIRTEWSLDYPAYRTSLDSPPARAVVASIQRSLGETPVLAPTLGGSLPIHVFDRYLDMPVIGVPIANADNNQHGANENLRLQNLWDGIDIYAGLLTDLRW